MVRRPSNFRRRRLRRKRRRPLLNRVEARKQIKALEAQYGAHFKDFKRALKKAERIAGALKKMKPYHRGFHEVVVAEKASRLEACNAAIAGYRAELACNELRLELAMQENKTGPLRKIVQDSRAAKEAIVVFEKNAELRRSELRQLGYDFG